MLTLTNLIEKKDLEPGDLIYIDTGRYGGYQVLFTTNDAGSSAAKVIFQGSTNSVFGGTVFDRGNPADTFLYEPRYMDFRDMIISNASVGIRNPKDSIFNRVSVRYCTYAVLSTLGDDNNRFNNFSVVRNTYGIQCGGTNWAVENGLLYNNTYGAGCAAANTLSISNTIVVGGQYHRAFLGNYLPAGDFNLFWNTLLSNATGEYYNCHSFQQDNEYRHSVVAEPLFLDESKLDFHEKSVSGTWSNGTWATFAVHSPGIDLGSPGRVYTNEPLPNGSNINLGAYGNTGEASKSRNTPWLMALTFNDGGTMTGTDTLYWAAGGFTNKAAVRIEYSRDKGASWVLITNSIPATNGLTGVRWSVSAVTSSPVAYWRVVSLGAAAADTNDQYFTIRGIGGNRFYVNATNSSGWVYCTAAGNPTNDGLSAAKPQSELDHIFSRYELGSGDTVYVDTGVYNLTNSVNILPSDRGDGSGRIVIQGSTNWAAGGSVFNRGGSGTGFYITSSFLSFRDLTLIGAQYAMWLQGGPNLCDHVIFRNNPGVGIYGVGGESNQFNRCIAYQNAIGFRFGGPALSWDHGISWDNTIAFNFDGSYLSVSNSVIAGGTAFAGAVPTEGDYNLFWNTAIGLGHADLNSLQKFKNGQWHSFYADPLFVNPAALDFHVKSVVGTYSNGAWIPYSTHSPGIDLGDPLAVYTNEPPPNGSNLNIGVYGNTAEASKSRTNHWIQALTYNDGGTLNAATGSTDRIYWDAGNLPAGATVRIELSSDAGATWDVAATNLLAAAGYYIWANTNFGSAREARWRVVYEANTNVFSATSYTNFTFRNGPYKYYVNDNNQTGDVYCTAVGNDSNSGTSPGSPKATLQALIDAQFILPGDIVYIDTGLYADLYPPPTFTFLDKGESNAYVYVLGSPNEAAGGTILDGRFSGGGMTLNGATYLDVRDITITNGGDGMQVVGGANGCRLTRVKVRNSGSGFTLSSSSGLVLDNCAAFKNGNGVVANGAGAQIKNSVFWDHSAAGVRVNSGQIAVSNCVIGANGPLAYCYYAAASNSLAADYNDLFAQNSAAVGYNAASLRNQDSMSAWTRETLQDSHSMNTDPLFAAPDAGDFHPKTETRNGRYIVGLGWNPGWDTVTSPLIDSGDPAATYTNEPAYNGSRVNIGLYGNADQASKGRTNAWLYAASLRDGGGVQGSVLLHWVAGGPATGHNVKVEFSPDGGVSWSVLSPFVAARNEAISWNTATTNNTPAGLWRVSSLTTPSIIAATTNFFAIRNGSLTVYVNDSSTNGDVYTTARGSATNYRASVSKPLDSPASAFRLFDFEPGDILYMDTGSYTQSLNTLVSRLDSGLSNQWVWLVGSTNDAVGGTVLRRSDRGFGAYGLQIEYAQYVGVSNLAVEGASDGIRIENSANLAFERVRSSANSNSGFDVRSSPNLLFQRSVASDNWTYGLRAQASPGVQWLSSISRSNWNSAIYAAAGTLSVSNSILHAAGNGAYVYQLVSNAVAASDYNDVLAWEQAYVAQDGISISKTLNRWQGRSTNDLHSLSHDPLFAGITNHDYHVRSKAGRYNPQTRSFVTTDTNFSPIIDCGPPTAVFANEPPPNGNRINIGPHGAHVEASKSNTNGWFVALTLNDGGVTRGTNALYWVAGGAATNGLVYIDYSADGGATWTNIATNISASAGSVLWNTLPFRSSTRGRWRITSQSNVSFRDYTDTFFALNNEPLAYYVNDSFTNGDVYTTHAGGPDYDGRTEDFPADSVQKILDLYQLQPGDRVFIDTGTYELTNSITINNAILGEATNMITFQGSTNQAYGGSRLVITNSYLDAIVIDRADSIRLRNLNIEGADEAVRIVTTSNCVLEWVAALNGHIGFTLDWAANAQLTHCTAVGMATSGVQNFSSPNVAFVSGVLYSNRYYGVLVGSSINPFAPPPALAISNSIIGVFDKDGCVYHVASGTLSANYNDVYAMEGAQVGRWASSLYTLVYEDLSRWISGRTQDVFSLSHDPLFNDLESGDLHLKSTAGRYDPVARTFVMTDTQTSPMIDAGGPLAVYSNEPSYNGGRINIGLYGNTTEASKTPSAPVLTALTLNDGGIASGAAFPLRWLARGAATSHYVNLQWSTNSGASWSNIVTGLPATNAAYNWDTTFNTTSTLFAAWRLVDTNALGVLASNRVLFALRNQPFSFYVNDYSRTGDVYTLAIGAPGNTGLTPDSPKDSVQGILDAWDIEAGDTVYIDTGLYASNRAAIAIEQTDGGRMYDTQRVVFKGSTNYGSAGSAIACAGDGYAVTIAEAAGVELRDLAISGVATSSVFLNKTEGCWLDSIRVSGGIRGVDISASLNATIEHSLATDASESGLANLSSSNTVIQNVVLWNNNNAVTLGSALGSILGNRVYVWNSVLAVQGANHYALRNASGLFSDYNDFYLTDGAYAADRRGSQGYNDVFDTVSRWALASGQDQHSLTRSPGFFSQPMGDYHPVSRAGRFDWAVTNYVTNDVSTSVLVDSGRPLSVYTNEPSPNGSRVNVGLYGNTREASKSPTNSSLIPTALNDGGFAAGTNILLCWIARGAATGHTVRLDFSYDAGGTWSNIASNVQARLESYVWNSTNYPSTMLGIWRIVDENEGGVAGTTERYFALRNGPFSFYVNDGSRTGDVYTTAIGASTNLGLLPSKPKDSLQGILNAWDLEPGDIVFVDTGIYNTPSNVFIGQLDSGSTNGVYVTIQGSTNFAFGGAVFNRMGGAYGVQVYRASCIAVKNLAIRGAQVGVDLAQAPSAVLDWVAVEGGSIGFNVNQSEKSAFSHCTARGASSYGLMANSDAITWNSGILWSNKYGAYLVGGSLSLTESVLGQYGTESYAYYYSPPLSLVSDYNCIFLTNDAKTAYVPVQSSPYPEIYRTVSRWVRDRGYDTHSLAKDPGFYNVAAGDYHLLSQNGRYVVSNAAFVSDVATSPLIDAGYPPSVYNPLSVYTNETSPNGQRKNIGLFGNTAQASRTPTNAALVCVSLNDGGRAEGNVTLLWNVCGAATGHLVRLDYSSDAGVLWQNIVSNLPAANGIYVFDSLTYTSSVQGLWRVVSENDPGVSDQSDRLFALRNARLNFYVNDNDRYGDVYTLAVGASTNTGVDRGHPKDSVQDILSAWDLEPGDTIYVDNGNYLLTAEIYIDRFDAWSQTTNMAALAAGLSSNRVTIQGSTNVAAGGTFMAKYGGGYIFNLYEAPGVALRHLRLQNASSHVRAYFSEYGMAEWVVANVGSCGFDIEESSFFTLNHCVAMNNSTYGMLVKNSLSVTWHNGVCWSNYYGIYQDGGTLGKASVDVQNSAIGAFGAGAYAYIVASGTRAADYNAIYLSQGALAAAVLDLGGRTTTYENVYFWSRATGQDEHTLTRPLEFADPMNGDFHLKTTYPTGRYSVILNKWTNDTTFSRLIDAGKTSDVYANESLPNGHRINIGLYGNTVEESKTPTNGWLTVLTLDDGGSVKGTVTLRWVAGGAATGHCVYLDFAPVSGLNYWTNIVTNLAASTGEYSWDTTTFGKSAAGQWRIASCSDSSISDTSRVPFIMRDNTGSIWYFVNDDSTNGDVYCTAAGNAEYPGTTPYWPKPSIQDILNTYKLEPVDVVYVDTGEYRLTADLVIGALDSGSGTNRVTFRGSTNMAAGGSVLNRQIMGGGSTVVSLNYASGINMYDFTLINAGNGLKADHAEDCLLQGIRCRDNSVNAFMLEESSGLEFKKCVAWRNGVTNGAGLSINKSHFTWDNGIIWDNFNAVNYEPNGSAVFSNSVIQVAGSGRRLFTFDPASPLGSQRSDYNDLIVESGALIAEKMVPVGGNDVYGSVYSWQQASGNDLHSLAHDPLFVDADSGDFHLKSVKGRYLDNGVFTNDKVTSPLIDTGNPLAVYTNEPAPNGSRINMGAYGNTRSESLSATNPWLLAVSFNDRPTIRGTNTLLWAYGNVTNGTRVRLEYSRNGGIEWGVIASNVPYNSTPFTWDVSREEVTARARWRVISQSRSNVADEVDSDFTIKNGTITLYINDTNTLGDIYTTAPGNPANSGLSNNVPLDDPQRAMDLYPIGAGDTVYIDTGYYVLTNDMILGELNRGEQASVIRIQGSTNLAYGGSLIDRNDASGVGLRISDTRYIEAAHLRLTGAGMGLSIAGTIGGAFAWIESFANSAHGFSLDVSPGSLQYCSSWSNGGWGVAVGGMSSITWENGVCWGNRLGAFSLEGGSAAIRNSVLYTSATNSFIYNVGSGGISADYNILWKEGDTKLGRNTIKEFDYLYLHDWQRIQGVDRRSALLDPLFFNAPGGDFHLLSQAGRYDPAFTNYVLTDTNTSWAIDAGGITNGYALEPQPNGMRLNAGLYGNTVQASKSLTNAANKALYCATLNDGGMVSEPKLLYWLSRGMSSSDTVRLEYTADAGVHWYLIASNLNARQGEYLWNTAGITSTPIAIWRVICEANTNISDANNKYFFLRNGPVTFYVNDANRTGDVYTSAIGSPLNNGLTTNSPKSQIQDILEYDLDGGDRILVDTGYYPLTNEIYFSQILSGLSTNPVLVQGSTNRAFGGSILHGQHTNFMGSVGFRMKFASYIRLCHLTIQHIDKGVLLEQGSSGVVGSNLLIRAGGASGWEQSASGGNRLSHCVITRHTGSGVRLSAAGLTMENTVIWNNQGSALDLGMTTITITNCILYASGSNYCYNISTNVTVRADYNDLYAIDGAGYGIVDGVPMEGVPQWTAATMQDIHSLTVDPLFFNATNDDYHLRSKYGRYDPAVTNYVLTDTNQSYLIDVGATNWPYALEPMPNGGRVNVGRYGNTTEASKSDTNAWVRVITASSGGRLEGIFYLVWAWGGMAPTNRVSLDYSYDNGSTWTNIGVARVSQIQYLWQSDLKIGIDIERWPSSPIARWRVVLVTRTNICDMTDNYFALRNHLFVYYLNDTSTVGDVYTTAIGSDTNLGIFKYAPKLTFTNLLDSLDIEGEDSVLIDTGTYPIPANGLITIGPADQGRLGFPVYIKGNTNSLVSIFETTPPGVTVERILTINAAYMDVESLSLRGGGVAAGSGNSAFRNLRIHNGGMVIGGGSQLAEDIAISNGNLTASAEPANIRRITIEKGGITISGTNVVLENSIVRGGVGPAVQVVGGFATVRNNTLRSDGTQFRQLGFGNTILRNNILIADGQDDLCIELAGGTLQSDYNNLVARNGGWIGNYFGNWEKLSYWQRESHQDAHSISADPLFANEAGGDYHLKSVQGRWVAGGWTSDAVHSSCIDLGDPSYEYTNEPSPNGSRVNIGAYGNSTQASKSRTNAWLVAISLNDGGVIRGVGTIRWAGGNLDPTNRLRLEYSWNNGTNWAVIATGLAATNTEYEWNTAAATSSFWALWRVVVEGSTNVQDRTDQSFAIRNNAQNFYVNDGSRAGDVYTGAIGNPANDALTTNTPKDTVQGIFDTYDTEAGDTIFVDTGAYPLSSDITVIWSHGGDSTYGNLTIRGSTNFVAGGSVIARNSVGGGNDAFDVKGSYVALRDLTIQRAYRGVYFESNRYNSAERLLIRSNTFGVVNFLTIGSTNRNLRLINNTEGGLQLRSTRTSVVENCTFVGNSNWAFYANSAINAVLQNNIFYINTSNTTAIAGDTNSIYNAFIDYNVYYLATNSQIYQSFDTLKPWQLNSSHDFRSSITNPLFANVTNDWHLRSAAGRYVDGSGWVKDSESSWGVDNGNPQSPYDQEPQTNGSRINIGAYGNTEFASKGTTNAYLEVRTLNEPTIITEGDSVWPLIWTAHKIPTSETVRVQFSGDGGVTWIDLTNGVRADLEYYVWHTGPTNNTYKGLWRVIGENNTNYMDISGARFEIFYGEFKIYDIFRAEGLNNIIWRGAWDEHYAVEYSYNMTNWYKAPSGSGLNQTNDYISDHGGDFTYADINSITPSPKMYRVKWYRGNDVLVEMIYIYRINNMAAIVWRCAEPSTYQVQYSTNCVAWSNAVSGSATNQKARFTAAAGGDFTFQDVQASNRNLRLYRVLRE